MKVCIGGEYFEFDPSRKMMAEMLELEAATGIPYGQWEDGLGTGSARSLAGLAWLLWHRAGRGVPFADITSGKAEINLSDMRFESDGPPADPPAPAEAGGKGASPPTGRGTSARSAK